MRREMEAESVPGPVTDNLCGNPVRVQLRRTKGWRMPANTVKVDRSTRWGNPWPVGEWGPLDRKAPDAEGAVGLFCAMLDDPEVREAVGYPADLSPLKGQNLACWCSGWCHADVLLELANVSPVADTTERPALPREDQP